MLAIYDHVAPREGVVGLFTDAVVSLFRQWVLRSEFRRAPHAEPFPLAAGGVPLLSSLESYALHPGAILVGCLLSFAFFFAVVTVSIRPVKPPSWLIGVHEARASDLPISRSSLAESEPNTWVRLGDEPDNPWRAVASIYFKLILVLGALDANRDFVLSPEEINAAPAALSRLDVNHDGRLSPAECGFSLGMRSQDAPGREFVRKAREEFMLAHPALAALDADHDGEISAEEIRNSSRHLLTLDSNGDGFLELDEVIPPGRHEDVRTEGGSRR